VGISQNTQLSRREFVALASMAAAGNAHAAAAPQARSLQTPYKLNRLVLGPSNTAGAFDEKSVDCPFVYRHNSLWYMTFVAFDGVGYQTGLASSHDLIHWNNLGSILKRDPNSAVLKYNVAMNWILRENDIGSEGNIQRVNGQYVGAYHAYPSEGYESGAAVIGLASSKDGLHWTAGPPILRPEEGDAWERGGLYKPCLLREGGKFYLFYNAKDHTTGAWHEQTGVAISNDLKTWQRYSSNPILTNGLDGSPDAHFASDPCVLRNGNEWAFFYFGLDNKGVARELAATGPDLFHATKLPEPLIDIGAPGSVDSIYAHKPSIVSHNGDLYHFYCAVGGERKHSIRGISVARSRPWGESELA
jgi:predicted GH43/DUF377 family glycosyl hydrolase